MSGGFVDWTLLALPTNPICVNICVAYRTAAERSSPRLRWPNGLSGATAKPDQDMRTVTVTVNGTSRLGLNFGADGRLFPVVESIEPDSLIATQCPTVEPGMVRPAPTTLASQQRTV